MTPDPRSVDPLTLPEDVSDWFRPPEPDELPGQPWAPGEGSLRDLVIKQYLVWEAVQADLAKTWRGRMILRYIRFRRWLRR